MTLHDQARELLDRIHEPLGLDRFEIRLVSNPEMDDARACCEAFPEYRAAVITVNPDRLETGDDLAEIAVHEATHITTWELYSIAEELANALADSLPETHREGVRKLLLEKVRQAGERCTTDVGHTYLRLLRRAGILDTPAANG